MLYYGSISVFSSRMIKLISPAPPRGGRRDSHPFNSMCFVDLCSGKTHSIYIRSYLYDTNKLFSTYSWLLSCALHKHHTKHVSWRHYVYNPRRVVLVEEESPDLSRCLKRESGAFLVFTPTTFYFVIFATHHGTPIRKQGGTSSVSSAFTPTTAARRVAIARRVAFIGQFGPYVYPGPYVAPRLSCT